ncbi:phosphohistidine phosphatase SixA [Aestuariibacter sp. AA17]|uniref:Phosphohistidine phosphatase SixA n=1 Tax=Fluctibacter corallii TaxID=2984329 RepID=A0ABT3AA97_9ALTE|nr:phosphohistidine phosphatase SixA [Aestuariibacter sp. AA17]MCV2885595.1 phosphohistidine phosphatase SixA [Aestuariibacter sp. AA17]
MLIFIMRHGEAEPNEWDDKSRMLTALGRKQSSQSGIWMRQMCESAGGEIDLALISPYQRTQQTFECVSAEIRSKDRLTCEDIVPSSDPSDALIYLDALYETQPNLQSVLLVSHMPFVSYFLDSICRHHYSMLFSAGSIAAVRYTPGRAASLAGQFLPE